MTFTMAEKLAAGSPTSLAEGTGWLGRQLLRGRHGRRRTNHLYSSTFHFPHLNNDLPHFPRRGTAFFEMLLPNIYLKCHTHTQNKMHIKRALVVKGC